MHAEAKYGMLGDVFGRAVEPVLAKHSRGAEALTHGAEFDRYSVRIWIVLSLLMSLAITSIFVKHEMEGLSIIPYLLLPVSLVLYFRARIARLGEWAYAATLVAVLAAAVLFGV